MKLIKISDVDLHSLVNIHKETRSGEYICDCVFCGKESHMYISRKTQLFDCKKCGTTGSIYKILKHLDKLYLLGDKTIQDTDTIRSVRQIQDEESVDKKQVDLPHVNMPLGFSICIDDEYLLSRGISNKDCVRYNIGKTKLVSRYKDYILFPIYNNEDLKGYLGRYANKVVPDDKLRYNNSLHTDFASLLYGYDNIVIGKTTTVIIVEGVFDLFNVDKSLKLYDSPEVKCICTFGKKISDNQIQMLIDKNISNVIISWDFDAIKEIKRYSIELEYYFNVFVCVCMKKKDLGDCNADEIREIYSQPINSQEFYSSTIGKIKR
jgi:5S rRNA maturation endonuclease (ribonuclease M5)